MELFAVYRREAEKQDFGKARLQLASRQRIHASLSRIGGYASLLEMNQARSADYSEAGRYVLARGITRDLLITIYDVNTSQAVLLRPSKELGDSMARQVAGTVGKRRMKNLEMRAIGLQEADAGLLASIDRLHSLLKAPLVEADLFGNNTRHIAFDTKQGMCYDLLLLDRIYKPHELANSESAEDFERKRLELKFV